MQTFTSSERDLTKDSVALSVVLSSCLGLQIYNILQEKEISVICSKADDKKAHGASGRGLSLNGGQELNGVDSLIKGTFPRD
jgi:hypothetical protein